MYHPVMCFVASGVGAYTSAFRRLCIACVETRECGAKTCGPIKFVLCFAASLCYTVCSHAALRSSHAALRSSHAALGSSYTVTFRITAHHGLSDMWISISSWAIAWEYFFLVKNLLVMEAAVTTLEGKDVRSITRYDSYILVILMWYLSLQSFARKDTDDFTEGMKTLLYYALSSRLAVGVRVHQSQNSPCLGVFHSYFGYKSTHKGRFFALIPPSPKATNTFNMRLSTVLPQLFLVVLAVLVSSAQAGNGICDTASEKSCYRACTHDPDAPRPCTRTCDC